MQAKFRLRAALILCVTLQFAVGCKDDDNSPRPNARPPSCPPTSPCQRGAEPPERRDPPEEWVRVVSFSENGDDCATQKSGLEGALAQEPGFATALSAKAFDTSVPRLANYCVHDFEAPVPASPIIDTFDPFASFDQLVAIPQLPQCDYPWEDARSDFWRAAGRIESHSDYVDSSTSVRVAVIDTYPDQVPFDRDSRKIQCARGDDHGYVLARVLEDLLCSTRQTEEQTEEVCFAEVATYQAVRLPLNSPAGVGDDLFSRAGGSQSELARAIYRAVSDHLDAPGSDTKRLVINLSLGWAPKPEFGGEKRFVDASEVDDREFAAPAAVFDAIRYAWCRGALVVAAAGNNLGSDSMSGTGEFDDRAVYPAGWAIDAGDPGDECPAYDVTPRPNENAPSYVISVGAYNNLDSPLAMSRRRSASVMAAGAHAVSSAPADGDNAFTSIIQGTSAATIVVSAAAAAVWARDKDQSAAEVFKRLTRGTPVSNSEPYSINPGSDLRKVRVCEVLGTGCDDPESTFKVDRSAFYVVDLPDPVFSVDTECYTPPITVSGTTTAICLQQKSIDEAPRIHEQPGCDPCPNCFLRCTTSTGISELTLSSDGSPYTAQWLELIPATGPAEYFNVAQMLSDNPPLPTPPNSPIALPGIEMAESGCPTSGRLIWEQIMPPGGPPPEPNTTASELVVYLQ